MTEGISEEILGDTLGRFSEGGMSEKIRQRTYIY